MKKPISFGDFHFDSKKDAIKESQDRINKYSPKDIISLNDELYFISLFRLHSEFYKKRGVGIKHIRVELDFHRHKCLYIVRIDGTETDCSWRHCITPASTKTVVSMAFRRVVKERIMEFKKDCLVENISCPLLNIPLNFSNSHVSYIDPDFESLLKDFLSRENITYDMVKLKNPLPSDIDQRGIVSDSSLSIRWNDFHREKSRLHLISEKANLSRLKNDL